MARRALVWIVAVALAANALLWLPMAAGFVAPLQAVAVLLLAGLLPGLLLVELVVGRSAAPPTRWERALLAVGAGYGLMVVTMLLVSYLPGPATRTQTLLAVNGVLALGLALCWWRSATPAPARPPDEWHGLPTRWLLAGALVLLLLGGGLRLVNLGYPDYQGDEARAALRAAAVIQGYDDVLMLHKKGPTEILLPTLLYSATGHLTEQTARLPFALASIAAIFAAWLLGWRLFGPLAGWLAALFITLDGYFIGFARIVQYQSVVLLMSLLAVGVMVRIYRRAQPADGESAPAAGGLSGVAAWLSLTAFFLATGALSHYEGVLAAIPVAFLLLALFWEQRRTAGAWKPLLGATLVAVAVGGLTLALFYAPYILNPRFAATYYYLTDRRIGNSFPYNNLADVWTRTTLYSTTYVVLLLVGLALAGLIRVYLRGWSRPMALALATAAALLFVITFWNPSWLLLGATDWLILPVALLFGIACITPRLRSDERALWVWFSAVLVLAIFLTEKPRTHVYTFFIPWMLIAGEVAAAGYAALRRRTTPQVAQWVGAGAAAILVIAGGFYAWRFFVSRDEVMLNYAELRPAGYLTTYTEPDDKARFGFPLNNAWKVVGELYRDGTISGPFETSEKEAWVPAWYSRGEDRCRREAEWFFEIRNLEPFSNEDAMAMEHYLREGFEKVGRVQVGGTDKLIIYERTGAKSDFPTQAPVDGLPIYAYEEYAAAFDANAAANLPLTYPSVDPAIANPLDINFGNLIRLEGYAIEHPTPLRQGDEIKLTLYWRGQAPIPASYKVFNQVIYGDGPMIAQRDGYPVCDGRETWRWDPGELITDSYTIPVNADAPDGLYPLYTGLYLEETGERLPVLDADGVEIASQAHITDVRVGEE